MPKRKTSKKPVEITKLIVTPRNPYATHPLLKKGGVHEKSNKALRASTRQEAKQQARDWAC